MEIARQNPEILCKETASAASYARSPQRPYSACQGPLRVPGLRAVRGVTGRPAREVRGPGAQLEQNLWDCSSADQWRATSIRNLAGVRLGPGLGAGVAMFLFPSVTTGLRRGRVELKPAHLMIANN
jgi:hypothetical protein